ncbi:hypothetical protein Poras_1394 [Porphyromonas asaccharolytica DSM 20707]|uniref:Uncharacterized protein n=1 Tax=Porphyromonas asaccharolytica (strain ATCC 25260 / DSM 20707 / BCRC 10618 / CCUG 7834 / JCM 6326 / LMG 13178 / VPI 4198 / B440) TaxID=879243 RepID=F4KMM9_PORAD|nr:hypothetical protein Poras_1394 [Porphyromonas asaccharolytica DSM 20707]
MKRTEQFIRTIAEYPNGRVMTDPLFAPNLQKPHKNIEECILYILSEVQRSACNGFADEEIYSMAVHYYDEDDVEEDKERIKELQMKNLITFNRELRWL